jgi:hypothetical protein
MNSTTATGALLHALAAAHDSQCAWQSQQAFTGQVLVEANSIAADLNHSETQPSYGNCVGWRQVILRTI